MTRKSAVPVILTTPHRSVASLVAALNKALTGWAPTVFSLIVPPRRRHQLPPNHLVVGPVQVTPVASARDQRPWCLPQQWHDENARDTACELLLWHSSTDSRHPSIATVFNVDDAHLQFHNVEDWLLQCGTGRSNALRPCTLSLTPPLISRRVRSATTTYHLFSSTFTGCGWPNVYSTSSVYLYTAAYTDQHNATFNRQSVQWRAWNHGVVTSSDLMMPATRKSTPGDRSFAVAGPRAWNNLPDTIRHSPSMETSKRSFKFHFFFSVFA